MDTHADKTQENKRQAVSTSDSKIQSGGESAFQFVDNRPEAIAQWKLQEMANNSPQVSQQRAFQDMANNSPHAKQTAQLQGMAVSYSAQQQQPIQKKENNTGLPNHLKSSIENLSGYSMDDVKVHYNSDKPAQLNAHAIAQGTDIHLSSGQEKHLPHEAWHVVQQKQGRVRPTLQMKGNVQVNDDVGLEKEADIMGNKTKQNSIALTQNHLLHDLSDTTTIKPTYNPVQRELKKGALNIVGENHEDSKPYRKAEEKLAREIVEIYDSSKKVYWLEHELSNSPGIKNKKKYGDPPELRLKQFVLYAYNDFNIYKTMSESGEKTVENQNPVRERLKQRIFTMRDCLKKMKEINKKSPNELYNKLLHYCDNWLKNQIELLDFPIDNARNAMEVLDDIYSFLTDTKLTAQAGGDGGTSIDKMINDTILQRTMKMLEFAEDFKDFGVWKMGETHVEQMTKLSDLKEWVSSMNHITVTPAKDFFGRVSKDVIAKN